MSTYDEVYCRTCGRDFTNREAKMAHDRVFHTSQSNDQLSYESRPKFDCPACLGGRVSFLSKSARDEHLEKEHVLCSDCNEWQTSPSFLQFHVAERCSASSRLQPSSPLPSASQFSCEVCEEEFQLLDDLTEHMEESGHGAEREQQEDDTQPRRRDCGWGFVVARCLIYSYNRDDMLTHRVAKHGDYSLGGDYRCPRCGGNFGTSHAVRVHMDRNLNCTYKDR